MILTILNSIGGSVNSIGGSVINRVSKPTNFGMSCMHVLLWINDYNADSDCVCVQ